MDGEKKTAYISTEILIVKPRTQNDQVNMNSVIKRTTILLNNPVKPAVKYTNCFLH